MGMRREPLGCFSRASKVYGTSNKADTIDKERAGVMRGGASVCVRRLLLATTASMATAMSAWMSASKHLASPMASTWRRIWLRKRLLRCCTRVGLAGKRASSKMHTSTIGQEEARRSTL